MTREVWRASKAALLPFRGATIDLEDIIEAIADNSGPVNTTQLEPAIDNNRGFETMFGRASGNCVLGLVRTLPTPRDNCGNLCDNRQTEMIAGRDEGLGATLAARYNPKNPFRSETGHPEGMLR